MHLKKGDDVVVISGNHKGQRGQVQALDKVKGRVTIEGVNVREKRIPKTQANPQGGSVDVATSIAASSVLLWSEKAGKGVRTHIEGEGKSKVRVGIPCGTKF